jgi:hypothetical protein
MPDWKKRVSKDRAGDLRADEELIDACFFQGRGTLSAMVRFGAIQEFAPGPDFVVDREAARAQNQAMAAGQAKNFTPDGSLAARIPDDKGVIAITTQRVLVFGYKQGVFSTKIEDLALDVSRQEVVDWQYQSGKATSLMGMTFTDESSIAIELPRLNKPDDFARAINIPFVEAIEG